MPRFDPDEAEKVRDRLLQELAALEDEPMQKVFEVLQTDFFAGHPYGNCVAGHRGDDAHACSPEDLRAFWERTHLPNNTIVAAAGKLDFDALVRASRRPAATGCRPTCRRSPASPAVRCGCTCLSLTRESNQQHIGIGAERACRSAIPTTTRWPCWARSSAAP